MSEQQRFIREALDAHNDYRRRHGVPPLEHNPELSKTAHSWAKYVASRNSLQHSKNEYNGEKLGENVAIWYETDAARYDGKQATSQWYDEIKNYNFSRATFTPGTGHFTQVVWKNSKQVGFGVAQSSDGSFYAVANYYPAGNFIGEFKENVLPLFGDSNLRGGTLPSTDSTPKESLGSRLRKFNISNQEQPNLYEPSTPKSPSSPNQFISEALTAHNEYRRKHGVPNLEHNSELSKIAQSWANFIASRGTMQHSKNDYNGEKLGENISMWFQTGAKNYDGKKATSQWYDEIKNYNFSRATFIPGTGHFTQVVWKNSKQVGFGVAQASDGSFYAVANYYPAGNYIGEFKENVLPLLSDSYLRSNDDNSLRSVERSTFDEPKQFKNEPVRNEIRQDNTQSRFITEALAAHNECRRKHGAPSLEHNPELSRIALDWAKNLALNNSVEASKNEYNNKKLGENISKWFKPGATSYDGFDATMEWYNEIEKYNYNKSGFSPQTGHFTAVVWKDTKQVGFAVAQSYDGTFYAVANYYPAGNMLGRFKDNVLPLLQDTNTKFSTRPSEEAPKTQPNEDVNLRSWNRLNEPQESFINAALRAHNEYRRKHGVPSLKHNPEISTIAQNWAEQVALRNKMQPSGNKYNGMHLGENMSMWSSPGAQTYDGQYATKQWYETIRDHDFSGEYSEESGSFTQLVWKDSKEVGFGVARASNGTFYAVANYFPSGNYSGMFKQNVFKP